MPLTGFVDKETVITHTWLNKIDALYVSIFGESITKAQARAAITSDAPMSIGQGGTGSKTSNDALTALTATRAEAGAVAVPVLNKLRARCDVRDFGVLIDGSGDQTAKMQAALDAENEVFIPDGTVQLGSTLRWNDAQFLRFQSRDAILRGNLAGALLKGKNAETERRYRLQIWSGTLDNTSRATAGGIALDLFAASMCKIYGTEIRNAETGVRGLASGALGSFYNEFSGVDILTVNQGYELGTLANEWKTFGGRVNECVVAVRANDCSGHVFNSLAVEAFTTIGFDIAPTTTTQSIRIITPRLENTPTVGIGIRNSVNAQATCVIAPQYVGLTTNLSNAATDYSEFTDTSLILRGGSSYRQHFVASIAKDLASLASLTGRAEVFTVPGISGTLTNWRVSLTLPSGLPDGYLFSQPMVTATDTVRVWIYNTTAGALDPASLNFLFDCQQVN